MGSTSTITINTNLSSLTCQKYLRDATKGMNTAMERLSTGFKINSAADDAAGYAVYKGMEAKISGYDIIEDVYKRQAMDTAKQLFGEKILYAQNAYDALSEADAMLLLTEWNEFRRPDYDKMAKLLKQKIIFDGRNQYDKAKLISKGFEYYNIGE